MTGSRYKLPDPKCRHAPKGVVIAGALDGPFASTHVCDRPACIDDAKDWAEATVRLPARFCPGRPGQLGFSWGVPEGMPT